MLDRPRLEAQIELPRQQDQSATAHDRHMPNCVAHFMLLFGAVSKEKTFASPLARWTLSRLDAT